MVAPAKPDQRIYPVYVVHGPDRYLRRQWIDRIVRQVLGDPPQRIARSDFEEPQADLAEVLDELRTAPFLGQHRLVVLHEADRFIQQHRQSLERYLQQPSPTGVLLLICQSWPGHTRLARLVRQIGTAIDCKPPTGPQLPAWLIAHARQQHRKRLQPDAARLLIELSGNELAVLCSELDKLALYVGQRQVIGCDDVASLTGRSRPERVFGIVDAVAEGDPAAALRLWQQVLATDRDAPFRAIAGLAWAVRKLLQARQAYEAGSSVQQAARMAGLRGQPQAIRARLKSFTAAQLAEQLSKLHHADLAAKTGLGSVQMAVEKFIVEQCMARQAGRRGRPTISESRNHEAT